MCKVLFQGHRETAPSTSLVCLQIHRHQTWEGLSMHIFPLLSTAPVGTPAPEMLQRPHLEDTLFLRSAKTAVTVRVNCQSG